MQEAVKAKKAEKKQILDEFIAATGYHRKVATQILKHGRPRCSGKKHGLPKIYQGEVVVALEQIWEVCGRICDHPDSERTFSLMKAESRYECGGGDGEAHRTRKGIARKRKTAAKGDALTAVFLLIVNFRSIPLPPS